MADSTRSPGWTGSAQEWVAFFGWMIVFLVGPAVPQLLQQSNGAGELRVAYDGPVYFANRAAYALEIENVGREPKHRVRIRAPVPQGGDVAFAPGPYESARALESHDESGYRVIELGDLKPGERYAISFDTSWTPRPDRWDIPWVMAQVLSAESNAPPLAWRFRAYRDEANVRWYRDAFELLSAAVVLLLVVLFRLPTRPAPPAKKPLPKEIWRRPASRPSVSAGT